jgi:hypothetical protein
MSNEVVENEEGALAVVHAQTEVVDIVEPDDSDDADDEDDED